MRKEAEETERRCKALIDGLEGKKSKIQRKGRETKSEAAEMMKIYLGRDADEPTASSSSRWRRTASSATGRSSA